MGLLDFLSGGDNKKPKQNDPKDKKGQPAKPSQVSDPAIGAQPIQQQGDMNLAGSIPGIQPSDLQGQNLPTENVIPPYQPSPVAPTPALGPMGGELPAIPDQSANTGRMDPSPMPSPIQATGSDPNQMTMMEKPDPATEPIETPDGLKIFDANPMGGPVQPEISMPKPPADLNLAGQESVMPQQADTVTQMTDSTQPAAVTPEPVQDTIMPTPVVVTPTMAENTMPQSELSVAPAAGMEPQSAAMPNTITPVSEMNIPKDDTADNSKPSESELTGTEVQIGTEQAAEEPTSPADASSGMDVQPKPGTTEATTEPMATEPESTTTAEPIPMETGGTTESKSEMTDTTSDMNVDLSSIENQLSQPAVSKTEEPATAIESEPSTSKKIFSKIALLGLEMASADQTSFNKMIIDLFDNKIDLIIDSKEGLGNSVIQTANSKGKKVTGVYLKTYISPKAQDAANKINENQGFSVLYSNYLERLRHLAKEPRLFVIFDSKGLEAASIFTTLWTISQMYLGQNKPLIVVGDSWKAKLDTYKTLFGLTDEDLKSITIVSNPDQVLATVQKFDQEYAQKGASMPVEKVVDRRVEGDEKDFIVY